MTDEANKSTLPRWLRTILIGRNPKWTLARIAALVVTCFLVFKYIFLLVRVEGSSMLPTYRSGHVGLIYRLAYISHEPQRYDIVSIRFSAVSIHFTGKSPMLMKRVVGLPGETVAFVDGKLMIDGKVLTEPYVKSWCRWDLEPQRLGPGEFYVVGDNRAMPEADHEKGVAKRDRIVGKLIL
jgi:signal peptidase I